MLQGTPTAQRKLGQSIMTVQQLELYNGSSTPSRVTADAGRVLGELGPLITRLASTQDEIELAQRLRYDVFVGEMGAVPSSENRHSRLDRDPYDAVCDHLLVIDRDAGDRIVGTYRLLPGRKRGSQGFYTATEFSLDKLLLANTSQNWLELGRSCIHRDYRSKRTMELLWQGTWAYAVGEGTDIMFGCASFPGTDVSDHAAPFAWLAANAALADNEACAGVSADTVAMANPDITVDPRRALAAMPPLLKGYLRLGAKVASHAVIDRQFGTTDVLVVLKVADINPRYIAHYGADATRFAAAE
ncbi:GNAT family N-acetyltransferase [Ahrensia sp. R2A130]|uniref:GNAT family N-acetyltransferase n=1 Tax=Ahrensia sp. R2A130 TaxID=744979 RepID=UPI0001E0D830|nr:GNAT family N-acyltransferase [Ahrensia sp. R2A130]EFL89793.1 ornithine-acyl[acyl carrier protein] N-acyltransferase [Ahrensia sp. R2A130]